nr:probable sodium/metabolite cotransporter BASS1, chloroplastic [Tanacetum cinerariifolium]
MSAKVVVASVLSGSYLQDTFRRVVKTALLFASLLTVLPSSLLACSYDELPLKSSRITFALLTILNEVDMNKCATGKSTIAMVDEPNSNGSATVSKFRCFEWICSGARKGLLKFKLCSLFGG